MTILNQTLNPINADERRKINENWNAITLRFSQLQAQIKILSGNADIEEILSDLTSAINSANERTNELISNGETKISEVNEKLNELDNKLIELQTALNNAELATQETNSAISDARDAISNINNYLSNFSFKGEYRSTETYYEFNFVRYRKDTYVALKENLGILPSDDGLNWRLVAAGGVDGNGNVSSVNEILPDTSGNITLDLVSPSEFSTVKNNLQNLTSNFENHKKHLVNVLDFGAKGDGVTDDSDSIQSALNSVLSTAGGYNGALVFFPAGTYLVSKTIEIYGNTTIQGVGRRGSTIVLKAGSTANAILLKRGSANSSYWTQIKDIGIEGQASSQTVTCDGIRLENATESLIFNVSIRNVRGNAIHVTGNNGQSSIQPAIIQCLIRADIDNHPADSNGIFLDINSYDGMIHGNDIGLYKNGAGIKTIAHNGAYFSDNNCWQCKNGYVFQSSNRLRVSNCLSDYAQEHGFFCNASNELQFSNCQSRWSSNGPNNVQVYDGFHFFNTTDFIVSGCTVYAGNGTDIVAGGLGRTALAFAFAGNTSRGKISGFIAKNTRGDFYKAGTVTDITQTTFTPIP